MERVHYARKFLNTEDAGGTAFIESEVHTGDHKGEKHVEAQLRFADCNRIVDLNFSVYTDDVVANVRYKLALIRRVVNNFADALTRELDAMEGKSK